MKIVLWIKVVKIPPVFFWGGPSETGSEFRKRIAGTMGRRPEVAGWGAECFANFSAFEIWRMTAKKKYTFEFGARWGVKFYHANFATANFGKEENFLQTNKIEQGRAAWGELFANFWTWFLWCSLSDFCEVNDWKILGAPLQRFRKKSRLGNDLILWEKWRLNTVL